MSFVGLAFLLPCIHGCFAAGRLLVGVGDAVVNQGELVIVVGDEAAQGADTIKRGLSFTTSPKFDDFECGGDFEVEMGSTFYFRLDCGGGIWLRSINQDWRKVKTMGNGDTVEL
eukprot:3218542-Amphidinium_carterae.1